MIPQKLFERAIEFAVEKHKGQKRKGDGRPYILHPMEVAILILKHKKSVNAYLLGTCAILHDVVEDCGVTLAEITKEFGAQVASIVDELTLDKTNYLTIGKAEYLAQHTVKMSSYALAIKLCDRYSNVMDLASMPKEFADKYKAETHLILERLKTRDKLTKTHKKLIKLIKKEIK
jgi:guanosine-3',5'-bis(diphosphate) 3'-pyrophosphohydrolase